MAIAGGEITYIVHLELCEDAEKLIEKEVKKQLGELLAQIEDRISPEAIAGIIAKQIRTRSGVQSLDPAWVPTDSRGIPL